MENLEKMYYLEKIKKLVSRGYATEQPVSIRDSTGFVLRQLSMLLVRIDMEKSTETWLCKIRRLLG